MKDELICIGKIIKAHGIKGEVELKINLEDTSLLSKFNKITNKDNTVVFHFNIKKIKENKVIASVEGVDDRNASEQLKGTFLFVDKKELPDPFEDEFYYSDLVDLDVRLENNELFGKIFAVHNYGASDILEIELENKKREFFPFEKKTIIDVNVKKGYLTLSSEYINV